MEKKVINSPFVRPVDREVSLGVESGETDYIDRKVYLEYVETGRDEKGKSIGSVQPVVRETKTNIQKLINSHRNEVGVKNLIALFARTGDSSLFNQRQAINAGSELLDLTKIPTESAEEIYQKIPEELRGNKDIVAFLSTLSKEQFAAYVQTLKAASSKKEEKEEVKDE